MGTIVSLHYELLLRPYNIGVWIMGLAALGWFLDHFVALIISFPSRKAWQKSFKLRFAAGGYRFIFDLHRSGGVWLWLLLAVFALTSVYYNIGDTVVRPVVHVFSPVSPALQDQLPARTPLLAHPGLDWPQALARAYELVHARAAQDGFTVNWFQYLSLDRQTGTYRLQFHTSKDIRSIDDCCGRTVVLFDADSGREIGWEWPLGNSAGDALLAWLPPLHVGAVWGLPHRIVLGMLGVMTATLSVTGVVIWLRKRRARRVSKQRPTRLRPLYYRHGQGRSAGSVRPTGSGPEA
jgi:uncharacterized iron-regulated membrane protein